MYHYALIIDSENYILSFAKGTLMQIWNYANSSSSQEKNMPNILH